MLSGGGAIEMELSSYLREQSRSIQGKEQLLIAAYAKALEVIPRQLCDNAGFDATNILNKLRQKHATGQHTLFMYHILFYLFLFGKIHTSLFINLFLFFLITFLNQIFRKVTSQNDASRRRNYKYSVCSFPTLT